MKIIRIALLLFSFTLSSCLTMMQMPNPMENAYEKDSTYSGEPLIAMRIYSNIDLDQAFLESGIIPKELGINKGYFGFSFHALSPASTDEYFYISWKEYSVFSLPGGAYKLTTAIYPPEIRPNQIYLHPQSDLYIEIQNGDRFVYGGDIHLIFNDTNEFGEQDFRIEIVDNFENALPELSQWLKDDDGNYILPENRCIDGQMAHFTFRK